MRRSTRQTPVFDIQARNRPEVSVFRDHGAVADRQCDGGDLDVDLLHGTTYTPKFGEQTAELPGGGFIVRTDHEIAQTTNQTLFILVACLAPVHARPELTQDRHADSDAVPRLHSTLSPL